MGLLLELKMVKKEIYLNEEEAIAYASITSSMTLLFFTTLVVIPLLINKWLSLGIIIMIFVDSILNLLFNYFKFNDLIKRRKDDKKKKDKK